jgi:hypothetical protein
MVVANAVLDGPAVRRQCLGEREGLAPQTGNALPERVIAALNGVRLPGFLCHGSGLLRWYSPCIDGLTAAPMAGTALAP